MNLLNHINQFVEEHLFNYKSKFDLKRKDLKDKYIVVSKKILVNYVVPTLGDFIRHLITLKGLDPDYVVQPSLSDVFNRMNHNFSSLYTPSWVRPSFKDRNKHPIYASRDVVKDDPTLDDNKITLSEPLTVVTNENSLNKTKSTNKVKPTKKTKVKKTKEIVRSNKTKTAKVTKNFGRFRRVSEE